MTMKKYQGSCHCKKVQYEVELDLSKGTGKCNCSFCGKVRNWTAITKPEAMTSLTGENELGHYQFNTKSSTHHFCKTCGVRTFTKGFVAEIGGHFLSVSLATLDNATPEELVAAPVTYFDALHDNWYSAPAETRHL